MASTQQIKERIKFVKNTKQAVKIMELIAANKASLRKDRLGVGV